MKITEIRYHKTPHELLKISGLPSGTVFFVFFNMYF